MRLRFTARLNRFLGTLIKIAAGIFWAAFTGINTTRKGNAENDFALPENSISIDFLLFNRSSLHNVFFSVIMVSFLLSLKRKGRRFCCEKQILRPFNLYRDK